MKVELVNKEKKKLNALHKKCLKGTEFPDYIDMDDVLKDFNVYPDNNIKSGRGYN